MSNSIEIPIDIAFFGGIDIGIDIDSGYPWKIDIGIDIDFLKFERLTLALTLTFLSSMSMGNQNPLKLSFLVDIQDKLMPKYKKKGKWDPIDWFIDTYFTLLSWLLF